MPATVCGVSLTVLVGGVDVSCDCVSVDVTYGRSRLWDPPQASTCQVQLDAGDDHQPPSRGPIGASVVVVLAYGATSRPIFTGTVQQRRVESRPGATPNGASAGDVTVVLDCVDAFEQLARINRRVSVSAVAVGAGDTVDERLDRWLDAADWTGARDLDPVDFTCPEVFLGARPGDLAGGNVLQELQHTAQADGGDFYIAGDGTATYRSWMWRTTVDDVTAIFSDRLLYDWVPYSAVTYRDDLDEVQNHITGVRADEGSGTDPVPQTANNASSVSTYGERGDALDELLLEDDGQVATRVSSLVLSAAQPAPRFDGIVVQPGARPSRMWPKVIPIDFGSLIATNRLYPDGSQAALYGNVIGQRWRITPTDVTVTLSVSGTGPWDAQRIPRLPIAVIIDPVTGCIRVPDGYPCDTTSDVVLKDGEGTVLATYPPGSLCGSGICDYPDGVTQVCLVNDFGEVCTDLADPRLNAVLWFDVLDPGPDLIERVEGDPVDHLAGFLGTRVGAIPGGFAAIDANATGGLVGAQTSDKLAAANLGGGWTIDWWLNLSAGLAAGDDFLLIDLGSITVHLTTMYDPATALEVVVEDASAVTHMTGPLAEPTAGSWQHWRITWNGTNIAVTLDGTLLLSTSFPYEPGLRDGLWGVYLPGGSSIGEVIVYATAHIPEAGTYDPVIEADAGIFAYWPLGELTTPTPATYDGTVAGDPGAYSYWPLGAI